MKHLNSIDCYTLTHTIPDIPLSMQVLEGKHATILQSNKRLKHVLLITYTAAIGYLIYKALTPKTDASKHTPTKEETKKENLRHTNYRNYY